MEERKKEKEGGGGKEPKPEPVERWLSILKIKHRLRARWGGCQGGDLNITRRTESRAGDETEYEGGYRGPLCQAGTPELYIAYTFRS